MLESEARETAISIIEGRRRVYCPMIRANCLISCECYDLPRVTNAWDPQDAPAEEDNSWVVSGGGCACHALKGGESFNTE